MKIVETIITDNYVALKILDESAPEHEWVSVRMARPETALLADDSIATTQLAALRSAQDAIVSEIRRLSGR